MSSKPILFLALFPLAAFAASPPKWCEVTPNIRAQLASIKPDSFINAAQRDHSKKKLDELLSRYPGNLFIHLREQDLARFHSKADRQAMIERYRKLMAAHPGEPLYQFLYAHALLDENTPQSIEIAKKVLAEDPDFVRAHVLLADAYSWGKFADHAQGREQIAAFFESCPGALDSKVLSLADGLADRQLATKILPPLEARLSKSTNEDELELWQNVWPLEFEARPVTEDAIVRRQIAAELARTKGLHLKNSAKWLDFLRQGYHLAGNETASGEVANRLLARFPESQEAKILEQMHWSKQHPRPGSDTKKQTVYWQAALQRSDAELKKSPKDPQYVWERFQALSNLKSTPIDRLATAGMAVVTAFRNPPDLMILPLPQFAVAQAFLQHKIHVDQVPTLVEEALANYRMATSHSDRETRDSGADAFIARKASLILLDAAAQLHQPDIAKAAVADTQKFKTDKPYEKSQQYEIDGKWAELEGRKLDALLYYRASIQNRSPGVKPSKDDKIAASENRLWKELGGTDATKSLLAASAPKVSTAEFAGWERPKKTMPPWTLTDLHGKTWALKTLEGKTVLINVWATWCGPCHAEHPYLQKLYDKLKNDPHIQIVTFDVDGNLGEVAPYMKQHHYTFPVLLAKDYVGTLLPEVAIPQNWIVNSQGVWKWQELGFGNGDQWEADTSRKLEATR